MTTAQYAALSLLVGGGWLAAGIGLGYARLRIRQSRRRSR